MTFFLEMKSGLFVMISAYETKHHTIPAAWVLVHFKDDAECKNAFIFHIQVRENYRRKGYATALVKLLQQKHQRIETDYMLEILDSPSTQLLLKNGFKIVQSYSKKNPVGKLVWEKNV